jgi:dihydroorotase
MALLLIKGGRIISPEDGLDAHLDVLCERGRIRQIAAEIPMSSADETIDATGQIVSPGFVDIHAHLREPGGEASETLETGLQAAVAGGFTAVCAMPNTCPVNDRPEHTRALLDRAARIGLARLYPIAAVSFESCGEALTNFFELLAAGAVAFSDDGKPVKTAALMRQALQASRELDVPIIDHCEDASLSAGGVVNEGPVAEALSVRGIPNASEDVGVARDVVLAEATGGRLHIAHVSTAGAVRTVRAAKRGGVRVTCEVTPHHFTLTDDAVFEHGANAKMNPPLRSARDVEAVQSGLADGTIDAIATDHAPHAANLKQRPLSEAAFGVTGLETALGLTLTRLVHPRKISLWQAVALLSTNPARVIPHLARAGLGRLQTGGPADITIFDPRLTWTYRAAEGRSKSRNTPFDGWEFTGRVTATIVGGCVAYRRC